MLNISDLKPETFFILDDQPFEVIEAKHLHLGRGGAIVQTKIKNLKSGTTIKRNFKPGDNFKELDVLRQIVKYIYNHRGKYVFSYQNNPSRRFEIDEERISDKAPFLKENMTVETLEIGEEIVDISLPIKIDLKVVEAPPSFKGDTAQGGTKTVILETGAEIKTPFFIKAGDTIRINTRKGEYVERISSKLKS
jgi:elongation factor P